MAQLHYTVVELEDQRQFWLRKENITGSRMFEMFSRLVQIYPLFTNFFQTLQGLFQEPALGAFGAAEFTGVPPAKEIVLEIFD